MAPHTSNVIGIRIYHLEIESDGAPQPDASVSIYLASNKLVDTLVFEGQILPGCFTPVCREICVLESSVPYTITLHCEGKKASKVLSSETLAKLNFIDSVCNRVFFSELEILVEYELWKENADDFEENTKNVDSEDCSDESRFVDTSELSTHASTNYDDSVADEKTEALVSAQAKLKYDVRDDIKLRTGIWFDYDSHIDGDIVLRFMLDRIIVCESFRRIYGDVQWTMTIGVLDDETANRIGPFGSDVEAIQLTRNAFEFYSRCSRYVYIGLFNANSGVMLGHQSIDLTLLLTSKANCYHGSCTIKELYSHTRSFEELVMCHFRIYTP